jgi:hypothetical protein
MTVTDHSHALQVQAALRVDGARVLVDVTARNLREAELFARVNAAIRELRRTSLPGRASTGPGSTSHPEDRI